MTAVTEEAAPPLRVVQMEGLVIIALYPPFFRSLAGVSRCIRCFSSSDLGADALEGVAGALARFRGSVCVAKLALLLLFYSHRPQAHAQKHGFIQHFRFRSHRGSLPTGCCFFIYRLTQYMYHLTSVSGRIGIVTTSEHNSSEQGFELVGASVF
jgi:hypothetical protein